MKVLYTIQSTKGLFKCIMMQRFFSIPCPCHLPIASLSSYIRTYIHTYSIHDETIYWFMVKPSEIGMKNGISHSSAGVLVFSFQLAITPPPETVIG